MAAQQELSEVGGFCFGVLWGFLFVWLGFLESSISKVQLLGE